MDIYKNSVHIKKAIFIIVLLLLIVTSAYVYAWIGVTDPPDDWADFMTPPGVADIDTATLLYWIDADEGLDKDVSEALVQLWTTSITVAANAYLTVSTVTGLLADPQHFKTTEDQVAFNYGDYGGTPTLYEWKTITPQWYGLRLQTVDTFGATANYDIGLSVNRQPSTTTLDDFGVE